MDMAGVGTLLSSLKTATEIAKFIKDSDLSLEKAEVKLKLAELVSALADVKLEVAEVQQQLVSRDERIRELEAEAKVRASLRWEQPCYWLPDAEGKDEPYCQNCYDGSKRLSRLHSDGMGLYQCRVCSNSFVTDERAKRDGAEYRAARQVISRGIY